MTLNIDQYVCPITIEKFQIYERLLREWNRRTGLVQEDTLASFDVRHILDSLQIIPLIYELSSRITKNTNFKATPESRSDLNKHSLSSIPDNFLNLDSPTEPFRRLSIIDVGTGAGFPGLVLAMCGFQNVHLCESNMKKCIFLEEVARQTDTTVMILNTRIEDVTSRYDIILSRAFTELAKLLEIMDKTSNDLKGYGLFHKGRTWKKEVKFANQKWSFNAEIYKSLTSTDGVILGVYNVREKLNYDNL